MTHTLPNSEVELLQRLKSENLPGFRARVRDLRAQGWTLQAIGNAVGHPRSTVRMWQNLAIEQGTPALEDLPPVPTAPERIASSAAPRTRSFPLDVPPTDRERLLELTQRAKRVRGWTPQDSPDRAAADELDELLLRLRNRSIPVTRLASASNVTRRAIAARLERAAARAEKRASASASASASAPASRETETAGAAA